MAARRAETERRPGGTDPTEERCRKAGGLDDAVFGQVAELHVAEGFPWAHHCDVSAEALHAGDVVSEAAEVRKDSDQIPELFLILNKDKTIQRFLPLLAWLGSLALECAGLPLLELRWTLFGSGGPRCSTGGQGTSCWWTGVHFECLRERQKLFKALPSGAWL